MRWAILLMAAAQPLTAGTDARAVNVCGVMEPWDFSDIPIPPFGGEYLGVGPTGTSIVNTTVEVQFTTQGTFDAADIAVGLQLVHVNGGASVGFSGAQLGWFGQGTFSVKFNTDSLNGTIITDQPNSSWLLFFSNLNPGGGPVAGNFDVLVFNIEYAACPIGDVNGDADVNLADLLGVIGAWGACPAQPAPCPADIDHSGIVNLTDLLAVISHWGPWCGNCK